VPAHGAPAGSHAVDLGPPQLVDGFANGWHVTSADLAAVGGANFTVAFTWTPQSEIWAALAVSAATLLLCLLMGFLPVRWRRALRARLPRRLRGPAGPDAPERPGAPFDATQLALPTSADRSAGERPRGVWLFVRSLLIGAVTGGVALLVVPPLAGLAVGVVVTAGLLVPWLRAVATVGGVAFIVAGCLNVVRGQQVHHYMPGSNWDGSFVNAGNLIWLGAVLLLADAVISAFGWRLKRPLGGRALRAGSGPGPGPGAGPTAEGAPEATAEDRPDETSEEEEPSEERENEAPEAPEEPEETPSPAAHPEEPPEEAPEEAPADPAAPPEEAPEVAPEAPEVAPEAPEEMPGPAAPPEESPEGAPEVTPTDPATAPEAPPATPLAPEETPPPAAEPGQAPQQVPDETPPDPAVPPEQAPASPVAPQVTPENAPVPVSPG
jgi:hypothetical protein